MPTLLIHLLNEDPVMGEVDELPKPTDVLMLINNPRRKDGKDLLYLDASVTQVVWPLSRVNFIEIMPSDVEDKLISHVRE